MRRKAKILSERTNRLHLRAGFSGDCAVVAPITAPVAAAPPLWPMMPQTIAPASRVLRRRLLRRRESSRENIRRNKPSGGALFNADLISWRRLQLAPVEDQSGHWASH